MSDNEDASMSEEEFHSLNSNNDNSSDEETGNGDAIFSIDLTGIKNEDSEDEEKPDADEVERPKPSATIIFIGNIPSEASDADIRRLFKKKNIRLHGFRRKAEKGYCYVDLAEASNTNSALELNGAKLFGRPLKVNVAVARGQPKVKAREVFPKTCDKRRQLTEAKKKRAGENNFKIFIKHLAEDVTEQNLRDLFPAARRIDLPRRSDKTNVTKGFAYVLMETEQQVADSVAERNGMEFHGRQLVVDYVGSKSPLETAVEQRKQHKKGKGVAGETKVLFIKNLNFKTTKETILSHFEGAKVVRLATLPDSKKSRGYGYIEFDDAKLAAGAHDKMQGTAIDGRDIVVDFASEMQTPPAMFSGKQAIPVKAKAESVANKKKVTKKQKT